MLLLVALADRLTGLVGLPADYDVPVLLAGHRHVAALLAVEEVVDKIAGADHLNDAVQTVVRPAAGALVMLAVTNASYRRRSRPRQASRWPGRRTRRSPGSGRWSRSAPADSGTLS